MRAASLLASALMASAILAVPLRSNIPALPKATTVADTTAIVETPEASSSKEPQGLNEHKFQAKDLQHLVEVGLMMVRGYSLIEDGVEKGHWDREMVKKALDESIHKTPSLLMPHDEMNQKFQGKEPQQLEEIMDMIIGGFGTIADGIKEGKWNKESADEVFDEIFSYSQFRERVDDDLEKGLRPIIHNRSNEKTAWTPEQVKFLDEQLGFEIDGMPAPGASHTPQPQTSKPEERKTGKTTLGEPEPEKPESNQAESRKEPKQTQAATAKREEAILLRDNLRKEQRDKNQKEIEKMIDEMAEVSKHLQRPSNMEPVWIAKPPPPPVPKTPEQIAEEEERKKNEPPKRHPTQRESQPPPVYAGRLPEKFAIGAKKIADQGQVHNTEEERRARHKTCPKCWA